MAKSAANRSSGKRKRGRPHHDCSPNPRQGAKETAHGRRPPVRGSLVMHCFLWTLILADQFGGIWEKQNRLNSSFKLSKWLGCHQFDPGQNSFVDKSIGPMSGKAGTSYSEHAGTINHTHERACISPRKRDSERSVETSFGKFRSWRQCDSLAWRCWCRSRVSAYFLGKNTTLCGLTVGVARINCSRFRVPF